LQRLAVDRLLQGMGARSMTAASVADALAACRDSADRSTSPLRLVVADEGLLDDPSLVEWIKRLRTTPGSGPLDLVLMWRKQANLPSDLPPHQMLGRPLTRHGLLRVIQGLRGAPGEHPASLLASNSRLAGARILIVDDYALNLEIVTTFLTDAGCVVATAANGAEAVDHVARNPVDAVLMDCQMPVMDGFDATRAIRQRKECQALPIIAMTANVLEADRDQCFAAGMNDFLGKPVMFEKLLEVLVKHLPAQRAVAAVADVVAVAPVASQAPATAPTVDFTRLQRIDVEAALATTMGKPEFLVRVLRIFVTTQTGFDAKFVAAQADPSDPEAAGRAAHTLKGAAASICAEPLRQAALALEQAAKQGLPQAEVKQRLDAVQVELEPVLEGIRQALSI
jgi:CheY-like chemotaxis protein/HPt (histidine-containing phosphotransfer) domain-containing protein